jgi:YD repeat-containing protein
MPSAGRIRPEGEGVHAPGDHADPAAEISRATAQSRARSFHTIYDLAGRLSQVKKNGATVAAYTYDSNDNRLSFTGPGGTVNGAYDNQDRMTSYGGATLINP